MGDRETRDGPRRGRYTISVAAHLAGVHPQTLRDYEKKGLLRPERTPGRTRLYSEADLERVRRVQELLAQGVNLAGAGRIVRLEDDLGELRERYDRLVDDLGRLHEGARPPRSRGDEGTVRPGE